MTRDCDLLRSYLLLVVTLTLACKANARERAVKLSVDLSRSSSQMVVKINCTFYPMHTSMDTVDELRIYGSKPNSQKNDLNTLASVNRWNSNPRFAPGLNTGDVDLSGCFGFDTGKSELSISWTLPRESSEYRYRCAAEGSDHNGQTVTVSELAELTTTEPTVEQMCFATNLDGVEKILDNVAKSSIHAEAHLGDRIEEVKNVLITSVENANKKCSLNVTESINGIGQKLDGVFEEFEKRRSQDMNIITNFFHSLQHNMDKLQKAVDSQASSIKSLETQLAQQSTVTAELKAILAFRESNVFQGKKYLVSKTLRPFQIDSADQSCVTLGGHLAEPDSQQEFKFILNFLKTLDRHNHYAVGVNDIRQEGEYMFYHSKQAAKAKLWALNEPNNYGGNEDCASIYPASNGYLDIPCDHNVFYICEVPS